MFGDKLYKLADSHFHIRGLNNSNLLELMNVIPCIKKRTGMSATNVASIPSWDVESVGQNVLCILFKALYPESYAYAGLDYYYGGIDESPEGRLKQAQMFMNMGFDGIKSIEYKPTARKLIGYGLNDARYDLFFNYLEKNAIPLLWHVADPEDNWDESKCNDYVKQAGWCYTDGTFLTKEEMYREVEEVLVAHPNLQVVFAHLFFLSGDLERAASFLDNHPNVRFDVTPGIEMYFNFNRRYDDWRNFFIKYKERLIFGSDNGWGDDISAAQKVINGCGHIAFLQAYYETDNEVSPWNIANIRGLNLPSSVLEPLYFDNFMGMQRHQPPKTVNINLAIEYSEQLYSSIVNTNNISDGVKSQVRQAIDILKTLR